MGATSGTIRVVSIDRRSNVTPVDGFCIENTFVQSVSHLGLLGSRAHSHEKVRLLGSRAHSHEKVCMCVHASEYVTHSHHVNVSQVANQLRSLLREVAAVME